MMGSITVDVEALTDSGQVRFCTKKLNHWNDILFFFLIRSGQVEVIHYVF